jgi:hypothetical protein
MARFEITLKDRTVEVIDRADAYQQEGQMTTFFTTGEGRKVVDCWSTRVASFRTAEVVIIRRVAVDPLAQRTAATELRDEWDRSPDVDSSALLDGEVPRRLRTA